MSSADIYHCEPWTPEVKKTAEELIYAIHEVAPELVVLFMGAAALGLPGKNDIDLDIICTQPAVEQYTEKLVPVLGKLSKSDTQTTFWSFYKNGFEVDAILSDPAFSHIPLQRARYEKLQSTPELLDEYRELKTSCDGMPYEEYEKRKLAFLENRVVAKDVAY